MELRGIVWMGVEGKVLVKGSESYVDSEVESEVGSM